MSGNNLHLQVLSGPLDGQVILLERVTEWGKEGSGTLSFPWDSELGTPQARFFSQEGQWWLETFEAPHGTYCANRSGHVEGKFKLEEGDVLKASLTWLTVVKVD